MSVNDDKFNNLLPPLILLSSEEKKELISKLEILDFMPNKDKAA